MGQLFSGNERTVDNSPIVCIEQPALVVERNITNPSVNRDTCVIDPRIKSTEAFICHLGNSLHVSSVAHISCDCNSLTTSGIDLISKLPKGWFTACGQHESRS